MHVCDKSNNLTLATSNNCEQFGYMLRRKRAPPQGRGPSEHIQVDKIGRANETLFKQCFASGLIVTHNSMLA